MTEDYNCKLCGKHFSDEDDYKNHGEQDHPEFNEMYGKEQGEPLQVTDDGYFYDGNLEDMDKEEMEKYKKENPHGSGESPADEIEQQEDKPVQSHDDWKEDLDLMRDQYSTEEVLKRATEDEESDQRDITNDINKPYDLVPKIPEPWEYGGADYKREGDPDGDKAEEEVPPKYGSNLPYTDPEKKEGDEEGGADDPLSKVADLAESYRYLSKDRRASLFESLDFTQRDSAILSGLEWNELTRPVKVEASEAFAKEEDEATKEETGEDPDVGGNEDEAYEALYNLEKNHSSPDYKKKAIECSRCNEKFYNFNDRSIHFNEVHTNAREYELPDQCPFCKEIIQEPETLDWHMSEQHGAHVPSQFTQTGVSAGMADTDFDSLESYKANEAKWECLDCDQKFDDAGKHQDETGHHNITRSHADEGQGGTYGRSDFMLNPQHEDETTCIICGRGIDSHSNPNTDYRGMRGDAPPTDHYFLGGDQGGSDDKYDFESRKASEASIYGSFVDKYFEEEYVMDQDGMYKCKLCGARMDVQNPDIMHGFSPDEVVRQHMMTDHGITEARATETLSMQQRSKLYLWAKQNDDRIGYGFDAQEIPYDLYVEIENMDPSETFHQDATRFVIDTASEAYAKETHPVGEPWQATNPQGETYEYVNELDEDGVGTHLKTLRYVGLNDPEGASESRASDLRAQIKKKENFINMASFENPLNMGDDQAQLESMKAELASLGETFGDYEVDCDCDKDPNCSKCKGKGTTTWTSQVAGEGYHIDLDDTTKYVDDSDNAGEKYICDDCGKEFKSDTDLQEHQFSYYHGDYKDDSDGETSPRNVMGGW